MTTFFLIKRLLGDCLAPMPIVIIVISLGLLLWAILRRKAIGRWMVWCGIALLVVFSYGLVTDRMLETMEQKYPALAEVSQHNGIKWVVVLGGGLVSDPRLPTASQLTEGSQLRVVEGIRLWRQLKGAKLLLSGGPVFNTVPESRAMAVMARELGVPAQAIAEDSLSPDTEAQVRQVRAITGGDSLLLVTSAYHMPRSMALFQRAGLPCLAGPANHLYKQGPAFNPDRLFPSSGPIRRAEAVAHEQVGLLWSRLRGRI